MAIIEKIKKIKQNGECADLPCYVPLSVANFLFKKKKKEEKEKEKYLLKDAASEVSNLCGTLLIVLLLQSWLPMRLNFFPFLFYFVCGT